MAADETSEIADSPRGWSRNKQTPESLERDAQALRLASMGYSQAQIDGQLKYGGTPNVSRALKRARERILSAPVKEHVAVQLAKMDYLSERLLAILFREHRVVSGGKIVMDDEGRPLHDSGPELACIRELRAVSESTRKLLGVDAAAKLEVDFGQSELDASIQQLTDQLESRARAREQAIRRGEA